MLTLDKIFISEENYNKVNINDFPNLKRNGFLAWEYHFCCQPEAAKFFFFMQPTFKFILKNESTDTNDEIGEKKRVLPGKFTRNSRLPDWEILQ